MCVCLCVCVRVSVCVCVCARVCVCVCERESAASETLTRVNESCHTCGRVVSHIWMSHVIPVDESCHTDVTESSLVCR